MFTTSSFLFETLHGPLALKLSEFDADTSETELEEEVFLSPSSFSEFVGRNREWNFRSDEETCLFSARASGTVNPTISTGWFKSFEGREHLSKERTGSEREEKRRSIRNKEKPGFVGALVMNESRHKNRIPQKLLTG
jgi:hypothetical protein